MSERVEISLSVVSRSRNGSASLSSQAEMRLAGARRRTWDQGFFFNSLAIAHSLLAASLPFTLERPTTLPPQPPSTSVAKSFLYGNVRPRKKSLPSSFMASSSISKFSLGSAGPVQLTPESVAPEWTMIWPSSTSAGPSPPNSVTFQFFIVLPSNSFITLASAAGVAGLVVWAGAPARGGGGGVGGGGL